MKKLSALLLILFFCIMQSQAAENILLSSALQPYIYNVQNTQTQTKPAGKSVLSANTPVIITNNANISTENLQNGSKVNFTVTENVLTKDGRVAIQAGTPVVATVTDIKQKGRIGKSASLALSGFRTTTVDGKDVALSTYISKKEDNIRGRSIALSVIVVPLFLLMKGKDVVIEKGTKQTAYTLADITVN